MAFVEMAQASIETWHGITPPNDAARRLVADIESVIGAFEAVRDRLHFEDEPSGFEAALQATKERTP